MRNPVGYSGLEAQGMKAVADALMQNHTLESMSLGTIGLCGTSYRALLYSRRRGHRAGASAASQRLDRFAQPRLAPFHDESIGYGNIGPQEMSEIAKALQRNQTLSELNLGMHRYLTSS